jgi:hypothetical protein
MSKTQPEKGWYIVYIPNQADQIVWRNTYYDLPLKVTDTKRRLLATQIDLGNLQADHKRARQEFHDHIRVVEEARYAAVKAKHVAEDEARIARAEADALRNDAEAWQQYKLVQANTPVLAELAALRAANEAFSGALQDSHKADARKDAELATLRAANARLREALETYKHEQCEGFCFEAENWFGDCAGCIARIALRESTP